MATAKRWYVLTVRSGFAPFVSAELNRQGVSILRPGPERIETVAGRHSHYDFVFAQLSLTQPPSLTTLPGFLHVAGIPEPLPVSDQDITNLKAATLHSLEMKVAVDIRSLQQGKILDGPLRGRRGSFVKHDGLWHLAIHIKALERTLLFRLPNTSVQINEQEIDRLKSGSV